MTLSSATLLAAAGAAGDEPPAPPSAPVAATEEQDAFAQARGRQAVAEYAEAADLYEAAARRFPKAPQAVDAWKDAVVLRLGLGDLARATQNAEAFERTYGAKLPAEAARLKLALAAFLMERDNFADARARLERVMPQVDKVGHLGDRIEAHASLGRALAKLKDAKGAEREYGVVRELWKDPQAAVKAFEATEGDDTARLRRLGKALTSVGEALFFFAEKKRAEVDAIRYPEYRGAATREQILSHVNTKVAEWVRQKRPAIDAAEKAYAEVLALQPAPPPRWVVASAARVGQMWGRFVAEFRAAPIPAEWKGKGKVPGSPDLTWEAVRKEYYQRIDEASEPQKRQAKAAFKACVDYAAKYQYFDEYSRSCAVWLAKNYPQEFQLVEELSPGFVGYGWSLRPSPLGEPEPPK